MHDLVDLFCSDETPDDVLRAFATDCVERIKELSKGAEIDYALKSSLEKATYAIRYFEPDAAAWYSAQAVLGEAVMRAFRFRIRPWWKHRNLALNNARISKLAEEREYRCFLAPTICKYMNQLRQLDLGIDLEGTEENG